MAIFWLGGPEGTIVQDSESNISPDEDRYFLPGIIHGGDDYVIEANAYNNDGGAENEKIHIRYLYATDILEWAKASLTDKGTLNEELFDECLCETRNQFIVDNDGSGEYFSLNEVWDQSIPMSHSELILWAMWRCNQDAEKAA